MGCVTVLRGSGQVGTSRVQHPETQKLVSCTAELCPFAEQSGGELVNFAPYMAAGGLAAGINSKATAEGQALAFDFFTYMSVNSASFVNQQTAWVPGAEKWWCKVVFFVLFCFLVRVEGEDAVSCASGVLQCVGQERAGAKSFHVPGEKRVGAKSFHVPGEPVPAFALDGEDVDGGGCASARGSCVAELC